MTLLLPLDPPPFSAAPAQAHAAITGQGQTHHRSVIWLPAPPLPARPTANPLLPFQAAHLHMLAFPAPHPPPPPLQTVVFVMEYALAQFALNPKTPKP